MPGYRFLGETGAPPQMTSTNGPIAEPEDPAPRPTRRRQRAVTLTQAYAAHPERFGRRPQPPKLPTAVWINEPRLEAEPQKQNP